MWRAAQVIQTWLYRCFAIVDFTELGCDCLLAVLECVHALEACVFVSPHENNSPSKELWESSTDIMAQAIEIHDNVMRHAMSTYYGYEVTTEVLLSNRVEVVAPAMDDYIVCVVPTFLMSWSNFLSPCHA